MTREIQDITLVGMDAHSEKIELCVTQWWHGTEPVILKRITTTLDAMEATFRRNVPPGAVVVLEASTNAFSIAGRLTGAGYKAKVLTSDVLAGIARPDRVNDRIDAKNLAFTYARGGTREVLVPSKVYAEWRDIWFGYRNAVKDAVKWSNRIWAFCSGHGFDLPKRQRKKKVEEIRIQIMKLGWTQEEAFHADMLLGEYGHACEVREKYLARIERTVAGNMEMTKVMQVLGIRFVVAFVLIAFIEDVQRFPGSKNLVSYIGLNPRVSDTGKMEGVRKVSHFGRSDLKALMIEAAQCAVRMGKSEMHKWARRKLAAGMHRNKVAVALARKMVCYVWHILMGHPSPNIEAETSFKRKLEKLAYRLGPEGIGVLGYKTTKDYVTAICGHLYPLGQLTSAELQTGSLASA
jgi:transposase